MFVASLPSCVQQSAATLADEVGCGTSIACACHNEKFLAELQLKISQVCADPDGSLRQSQVVCTAANPSLLDNRRATIIVPMAIFASLAILVVILRFYCRRNSKKQIGLDDWLAFAALILAMVSNGLEIYSLKLGEATHQFMNFPEKVIASNKSTIATFWVTIFAITLLKLSILALYVRLFGSVKKFAYTVYGVAIFTTLMSFLMAFLITFQCKPVAYFWNRAISGGQCWNFTKVATAVIAMDLGTGLLVLPLPIPMLWGLQMTLGNKIAIMGNFLLGGFTCLAGALRIPFILAIDDYDGFWTCILYKVFSTLMVNIGLISICLPAVRPVLFAYISRSSLSSRLGLGSSKHARLADQSSRTYGSGVKAHSVKGTRTSYDDSRARDSIRILDNKSEEEVWPMSTIGVTKEFEVNSTTISVNDSNIV